MQEKRNINIKGFTLLELLVGVAILVFVLCGLLYSLISCIILNETNRKFSLAYNAIQTKMEEIKNTDFSDLSVLDETSFNLSGFPVGSGKGKITVTDEASDLKKIKIVACFKCRGRVIGTLSDDTNLDSCTSSPVELVTFITQTE